MDAAGCSIAVFAVHRRAAAGQESPTSVAVRVRLVQALAPSAGSLPMDVAACSTAEVVCRRTPAPRMGRPTNANAGPRPVRHKVPIAELSRTAVAASSCAVNAAALMFAVPPARTDAGRDLARRQRALDLATSAATRPTAVVAPCAVELAKLRAPAAAAALPTSVGAGQKLATSSAPSVARSITVAVKCSTAARAGPKKSAPPTYASRSKACPAQSGILPCFFGGRLCRLSFSMSRA
jgi:hypothetical protein